MAGGWPDFKPVSAVYRSAAKKDKMMNNSVSPIPLVDVTRGGEIESLHFGHFTVATPDGSIVDGAGDERFVTFPRSALKPIQALHLVESGAADAYRLEDKHLCLACSSHWAEPFHVDTVSAWLEDLSCSETDLICGEDYPLDEGAKEALLRQNVERSRIYHNCSGKHAGFLTTCRHLSYDIEGYDAFDHPNQIQYRENLSSLTGKDADTYAWGIDGCALPAPALPMNDVARAMAKLADPSSLAGNRGEAITRLCDAIAATPEYFWGTGASCTELARVTKGRIIAKIGAEGYMVVIVRDKKLGISIKATDGTRRAVVVALFGVLQKLDLLTQEEKAALQHHITAPIKNSVGDVVGNVRPSSETFG